MHHILRASELRALLRDLFRYCHLAFPLFVMLFSFTLSFLRTRGLEPCTDFLGERFRELTSMLQLEQPCKTHA